MSLCAMLDSPHTYSSALGAPGFLAGTFLFDPLTGKAEWSDGLFNLHGYQRGEVVPTLELLMSHKHPEDRPQAMEILGQVFRDGGHFCIYHRIIDAQGHVRRVLTAGNAQVGPSGTVALEGTTIDLTSTLRRETEQAARDAVAGANATRGVINQARGILMGRLLLSSNAAFKLLVSCSSMTNVKVAILASHLVRVADTDHGPEAMDEFIRVLQACDQAAVKRALDQQ
ncbi:PAS and ANTAR domain-containing protein [Arthrobacter sp. efr-133-TYG-118]|uniref:PAS and ANTAR domain-containing protein n=1 Tax=Arthrobacter sp. efr-133-TYG-118 TaxID=3040279 RepID=UPI002550A037|nr:PAS and ANTAR domain-containing protein [Arthrobacter sp. efr-133-TYG-118]